MFRKLILSILAFLPFAASAQFNTDRVMVIGQSALYYEDYVLSIQYFNQVISVKPFLYEPWYYRAIAKYYLDDYRGAEDDCTEALNRNPFVTSVYQLRGLCRIQQGKYDDAINDYKVVLKYNPDNRDIWYNRVLCRIQQKNFNDAKLDVDTLISHWNNFAKGYVLQSEVYMLGKDTVQAVKSLDKSLELDPYDGESWSTRGMLYLSKQQWRNADVAFSKSIHLLPKLVANYIDRALARYNVNNLRGAMSDYDTALDYDPNNFLAHYNRGLLKAQVGDDNRAIKDFDYVLKVEPDNLMALFNRALLLDRTGSLRGAIRDYSRVISHYPDFWTGLHYRSVCYRKLGDTKNAEMDEFRIFKAQLDKRNGINHKIKRTRRRSEIDVNDYSSIVVADDNQAEHEYTSVYRGRVQDRNIDIAFQPMYEMTYVDRISEVKSYLAYDKGVDAINATGNLSRKLFVSIGNGGITESQSSIYFGILDSLTHKIDSTTDDSKRSLLLFDRAIVYSVIQNYDSSIDDLSKSLKINELQSLALWQRGVESFKKNKFESTRGGESLLKNETILSDFSEAIRLCTSNAYIYYDRGVVYCQRKEYAKAIADFNEALRIDKNLPEAYYNRGLALIYSGKRDLGIRDLSKSGELGVFTAYSVIKKYHK
jgi:tetratricopeptide (TPR) repeat protein